MSRADISGAFSWHRGPLEPVGDEGLYDEWRQAQRERWEAERHQQRHARRDLLGVVALLLAVVGICVGLVLNAKGVL